MSSLQKVEVPTSYIKAERCILLQHLLCILRPLPACAHWGCMLEGLLCFRVRCRSCWALGRETSSPQVTEACLCRMGFGVASKLDCDEGGCFGVASLIDAAEGGDPWLACGRCWLRIEALQ